MENNTTWNRIPADKLPDNPVNLIGKQWMLVCAGKPECFNMLTASWGAMGFIWNKPAAFITIRDTRYTYQFLEREEGFTLSFFGEEFRHALSVCGSISGRDKNKVAESGLTPTTTPNGLVAFKEARMVFECKKMYSQMMHPQNFEPECRENMLKSWYTKDPAFHKLFIAEIENIWLLK